MQDLVTWCNRASSLWIEFARAAFWQIALLVAAATVLVLLLRNGVPALRFWIWQIVTVKVLLMPCWIMVLPFPAWMDRWTEPLVLTRPTRVEQTAGEIRLIVVEPAFSVLDNSAEGVPTLDASTTASAAGHLVDTPNDARASLSAASWCLLSWVALVVGQVLRLLLGYLKLTRLLQRAGPADSALVAQMREAAGQLGLRRHPRVLLIDACHSPFLCGIWRPKLVLPQPLVARLEPHQTKQILLHELAHLKRSDLAWGWISELAKTIYIVHPAMWWVLRNLRVERESCCDQAAIARSGGDPRTYAETLVAAVGSHARP